jgi:hypothetical protein
MLRLFTVDPARTQNGRYFLGVPVGGFAHELGDMLLPQQHQRHALAAQFLVDAPVLGHHEGARAHRCGQQAPLQASFIQECRMERYVSGRECAAVVALNDDNPALLVVTVMLC